MTKRGVLATAFLAMAVGLAGADGDPPLPPENTIDCICRASTIQPKGAVEAYGQFAGFKQPSINESTIQFYSVTVDAKTGTRTETPLGNEYKFNFALAASGSQSVTRTVPSGTRVCAVYNITRTDGAVPINGRYSYTTSDFIVP